MNEDVTADSRGDVESDDLTWGDEADSATEQDDAADAAVREDPADEMALEDVLVLQEVDQELVLPVWQPTGVVRVDEALDELTRLDPDDVHQHAEVYTTLHQRLRDTLSDLHTTG